MNTQNTHFDQMTRVLSVINLKAICDRISQKDKIWKVEKVTRSRVTVEHQYTRNGAIKRISAVYPCYPSENDWNNSNPLAVLNAIRYFGDDTEETKPAQLFNAILLCPVLFVDTYDKKWKTRGEALMDEAKRGWPVSLHEDMDRAVEYISKWQRNPMPREQALASIYQHFLVNDQAAIRLFSDCCIHRRENAKNA